MCSLVTRLLRKMLPESFVESTSGELAIYGEDRLRSSSAVISIMKRCITDYCTKIKFGVSSTKRCAFDKYYSLTEWNESILHIFFTLTGYWYK